MYVCVCVCVCVSPISQVIDQYGIEVPALDKAAYATLDSTYNTLKTTMEEVESSKEENINKYNSALDAGVCVCVCVCLLTKPRTGIARLVRDMLVSYVFPLPACDSVRTTTALYFTVLYCTVLYCMFMCCVVLSHTVQALRQSMLSSRTFVQQPNTRWSSQTISHETRWSHT